MSCFFVFTMLIFFHRRAIILRSFIIKKIPERGGERDGGFGHAGKRGSFSS